MAGTGKWLIVVGAVCAGILLTWEDTIGSGRIDDSADLDDEDGVFQGVLTDLLDFGQVFAQHVDLLLAGERFAVGLAPDVGLEGKFWLLLHRTESTPAPLMSK